MTKRTRSGPERGKVGTGAFDDTEVPQDQDAEAWATDMNSDASTAAATPDDQAVFRIEEAAAEPPSTAEVPLNPAPDAEADVGTTFPREAVEGPWVASEPDRPYFPPTDPVIKPNPASSQGLEVVGGFEPTASDDVGLVGETVTGPMPGDSQIQEAVIRELREDAMTTDLTLEVIVREGDVTLRGKVSSLEESDAAVEVASRVEGVGNVDDQIEVEGLTDRPARA